MTTDVMTEQRYSAVLHLSQAMLEDAKFDVLGYGLDRLRLQLERAGAVTFDRIEGAVQYIQYEIPQKWWQRLLRRPVRYNNVPVYVLRASGRGPRLLPCSQEMEGGKV